jgi:hypothetical protein
MIRLWHFQASETNFSDETKARKRAEKDTPP